MLVRYISVFCVGCLSIVHAGFLSKRNIQLASFKYQPCRSQASRGSLAWADDVVLMTTQEGDLDITGSITTLVNLTSPIQARVKLKRSILGINIPVPCIKDFGTCDYPDLCQYGFPENQDCPPLFHEHDVPCGCPIPRGSYNLPAGQFKIPPTRWAGVLAGRYTGNVQFFQDNRLIACVDFKYQLE